MVYQFCLCFQKIESALNLLNIVYGFYDLWFISALIFIISSLLLTLGLDSSSFSGFLTHKFVFFEIFIIYNICIFFLSEMFLLHPIIFDMLFHFYLFWDNFYFPFISSLSHCLLKSVLFNFPIVVYFPDFFLLLVSSFIPSWLENLLGMISTLQFLRLVTYLYDLSWWMFCMTLKRM